MVISDMLYILKHFNFISFLLLILSCFITIVQHLHLDYCENYNLPESHNPTQKDCDQREKKQLTNQNGICLRVLKMLSSS